MKNVQRVIKSTKNEKQMYLGRMINDVFWPLANRKPQC